MNRCGFVVPPQSKASIAVTAGLVRKGLRRLVGDTTYLPLDMVYEVLPRLIDGFQFEVCDQLELGDDHGQTFPDRKLIMLREDVYDGMCRGQGRDRFTGAHELGHLFMHKDVTGLARRRTEGIAIFRDSEWQADTFASLLLIDESQLVLCRSIAEVQEKFGVSEAAAKARFKK